jgi:hypothetical protein
MPRNLNWSPTIWTPEGTSPTPLTLTGVQNIQLDYRPQIIDHRGDADVFPTTKSLVGMDPLATVTFRDLIKLHALAPGTRGSLISTHRDSRNGITSAGGAYTVQMNLGIVEGNTSGGQYAQYGEGSLMISGESADGITNPMVFAAL